MTAVATAPTATAPRGAPTATAPRAATEEVPARRPVPLDAVAVRFTGFESLPGRDLDKGELRTLAASVAVDPSRWEEHVAFADEQRHYVCLYRDAHVDVWVLCWTPANDTGWHDHDISSGAVAVVRGALTEHNLAVGQPSLSTDVPAGEVFSFGPEHIHRLVGKEAASVSIHAYSPPLWRMGQYSLGSTGILRRVSVSYADELRPLDVR